MSLHERTINYIKQDFFNIIIKEKYIDINNFSRIDKIEDNEIIVYKDNMKIIIKGNNLRINKLTKNELLIIGKYKSINFEGSYE